MSCFFARHVPGLLAGGWSIIPLAGKRPIIKGWQRFNHEMPGEDQVAEWCRRYPDANVGLAVGPASGVVAVDVDVTDPDAVAEVAKIADENFGPTPAVRTEDLVGPLSDDYIREWFTKSLERRRGVW